jgi:hypothetical protein
MRKIVLLASLAALVGGAGLSHAESLGRPCTDKPATSYLSLDALKAKSRNRAIRSATARSRKPAANSM